MPPAGGTAVAWAWAVGGAVFSTCGVAPGMPLAGGTTVVWAWGWDESPALPSDG